MTKYLLILLIILNVSLIPDDMVQHSFIHNSRNTHYETIVIPRNYTSLEEALEKIKRNALILIEPGEYNISAINLVNAKNLVLKGLGKVVLRITLGPIYYTIYPVTIDNAVNITLENLYIEIYRESSEAVVIVNSRNITFRNIVINYILEKKGNTPSQYSVSSLVIGCAHYIELKNVRLNNTELVFANTFYARTLSFYNIPWNPSININISHVTLENISINYVSGKNAYYTLIPYSFIMFSDYRNELYTLLSTMKVEGLRVNGREVVFIANKNYRNKALLKKENVRQIIVFNTTNLVIDNTHIMGSDFGVLVLNCSRLVLENMLLRDNEVGLFILDTDNIMLSNITAINSSSEDLIIIGSSHITIENSYFKTRVKAELMGYTILPISSMSVIRSSKEVRIENSMFSLTIFDNVYRLFVRETKFLDGLYIDTDPKYLLSYELINTTLNGKPIVFIKGLNMLGKSLHSIYRSIGMLVLYNVSNLVVNNYVLDSYTTPVYVINSCNITLTNITFPRIDDPLYIVNSTNIIVYACVFYDYPVVINSSTRFYSSEPILYKYNEELFYGYLGNYWAFLTVYDYDGNGISDYQTAKPPVAPQGIVDLYVLVSPPSKYHVIAYMSQIGDLELVGLSNNSVVNKLMLKVRIKHLINYSFWVKLILVNSSGKHIVFNHTFSFSEVQEISLRTYRDGGYTLILMHGVVGAKGAVEKRYNIVVDNLPPDIIVYTNISGGIVAGGKFYIEYLVRDKHYDKIIVYINEKPIYTSSNSSGRVIIDSSDLNVGDNEIVLKAFDKAGNQAVYIIHVKRPLLLIESFESIVALLLLSIGLFMLIMSYKWFKSRRIAKHG